MRKKGKCQFCKVTNKKAPQYEVLAIKTKKGGFPLLSL
jgi:hypothetical protein